MDLKLPKLKSGPSSPKQGYSASPQITCSPRQVLTSSQIRARDGIRLPKLDSVYNGTHKSSIVMKKISRQPDDDEQIKFENLIECLKVVDHISA